MLINKIQFQSFNNIFFASSKLVSCSIAHNPDKDIFVRQASKTESLKENLEIPDYQDIKQFSAYFEKKIKTTLQDPTEEDIKALVSEVSKQTGAKKQEVLEVVSRLTQFSNYSQLEAFNTALRRHNIMGLDPQI